MFERDGNECVLCHIEVSDKEKFHHQRFGKEKTDRIECGVVLCMDCHYALHYKEGGKLLQKKVELYLAGIYPDYWRERFGVVV